VRNQGERGVKILREATRLTVTSGKLFRDPAREEA
jgi:hypothetical protein